MGRLFGTDGIRGIANLELTCKLAIKVGQALAKVLIDEINQKPNIIVGMDTRESSSMLEGALVSGLCSMGANVIRLGVIPTPAVAYLVTSYHATAGVMISASHNPAVYNGIKVFNSEGYKIPVETEDKIESWVLDKDNLLCFSERESVGRVTYAKDAYFAYVYHLINGFEGQFPDFNIVVDCANGSTSETAGSIFTAIGAKYNLIHSSPNGKNINYKCGSTHISSLCRYVVKLGMDVGFAFDGDGDRCIAVDENGKVINGDQIIAILAKNMKGNCRLARNRTVVSKLSNIGYFKFAKDNDIDVITSNVGDRSIASLMKENGCNVGGEESGHIILADYETTGDGQLTAIQLLRVMKETGKKLSELAEVMSVYPQTVVNIKVSENKEKICNDSHIVKEVKRIQTELGDRGNIFVRASGTEPIIRVIAQGFDKREITRFANNVVNIIKTKIAL